jgi:radical SAM-linked protein
MAPDPAQVAQPAPPDQPGAPARTKLRIRFRKGGDLRLVSHHDLMRTFERLLRRASLPFRSSEGFHPKPRFVFALSLPLGIVGCEEVVELELDEPIPPEEVHDRLSAHTVPGLDFLSVRRVASRKAAQARRVTYRVALPPGREDGLAGRAAAVLASAACPVERLRPEKKQIDLRPYIDQIRPLPGGLEMDLWVKPSGMARPDEVLGLLGLADVSEAGAVIERTRLELEDETTNPASGVASAPRDTTSGR